jgi:hypothetical protein
MTIRTVFFSEELGQVFDQLCKCHMNLTVAYFSGTLGREVFINRAVSQISGCKWHTVSMSRIGTVWLGVWWGGSNRRVETNIASN